MLNFTKMCFIKSILSAQAQIWVNELLRTCLLYNTTHSYSYTVIDRL